MSGCACGQTIDVAAVGQVVGVDLNVDVVAAGDAVTRSVQVGLRAGHENDVDALSREALGAGDADALWRRR